MEAKEPNTKAAKRDYIILGSGIAGMAAAEAIRETFSLYPLMSRTPNSANLL